ncbi:MAG TPA: sterol desaturase family protein [Phenylobacterium sp.]|nr:sterol desaturase family protein [Phenylobacterium sp.]
MSRDIDPVTLAVPFFILAIFLEIIVGRLGWAHADYEPRDTFTSLTMGLGSSVAGLATGGLIFAASLWVYEHRLFNIPLTAIWAWVLLFLLEDLTYYWFHRLSHERRFWWARPVKPPTPQHHKLSPPPRQTRTRGAAGTRLPLLPRVHHARNPRYLDRNYAGILIIWDRLFGTFQAELDDEPCRYGVVKNLATFNPIRVAFHEWIAMGRDVFAARSPREVMGYVFGPPGWSADGSRETSDQIRAGWEAREAKRCLAATTPAAAAETAQRPAARSESLA